MRWTKTYDKCTLNNDDELVIFGGHYNLEECWKIIEDEDYDMPDNWVEPEEIWVRFGFVSFEGEVTNGWQEYDEYKRGRVQATRLKNRF